MGRFHAAHGAARRISSNGKITDTRAEPKVLSAA
jgi:hypothetical protein